MAALCWLWANSRTSSRRSRSPPQAIIVPGGGLTKNGAPNPWVVSRIEMAAKLFHAAPIPPSVITLSWGTTWKPPPIDAAGFPISEAAASAIFLANELGVDYKYILEEGSSLDTIGNAYYLRTVHIDPRRDWRHLAVVTNRFHMPRTKAIFNWVFSLPPVEGGEAPRVLLSFFEADDTGIDAHVLALRREKEAKALEHLFGVIERVRSLRQLHMFVFNEHKAYAAVRHTGMPAHTGRIDEAVRDTY